MGRALLLAGTLLIAGCGGGGGGQSGGPGGPSMAVRSPLGLWFASVAFHPTNANVIFFGHDDGGGVYRSADGGATASYASGSVPDVSAWSLSINPANGNEVIAGDFYGHGVFKSVDGGTTWAFKNGGLPGANLATGAKAYARALQAVAHDPTTPSRVFALTDDGFYRSTDGGETWSKTAGQPVEVPRLVGGEPTDMAWMAVSLTGRIFVGGAAGKLSFSSDQGATWSLRRDFLGDEITDIDVDPTNANLYVVTVPSGGGPARIYRGTFTDASVTWTQDPYPPFTSSATFGQIAVRGETKVLAVLGAANGAVWRNTSDVSPWVSIGNNIPAAKRTCWRLAMHPLKATPSELYVSTFNGFFRTTNADAAPPADVTWTEMTYGLRTTYPGAIAADPSNPARWYMGMIQGPTDLIAAGMDNLFTSADAGVTWTPLPAFTWNPVSVAAKPEAPATLLGGTFTSGVKRSVDSGATWSATSLAIGLVQRIVFHPTAVDLVLCVVQQPASDAGVWRSADGGGTWTRTLAAGAGLTGEFLDVRWTSSGAVAAGRVTDATGMIVQGGAWSSPDGIGWTNRGPAVYGTAVAVDPAAATKAFCGTPVGLYRTVDFTSAAPTWTQVDPGWQGQITAIIPRSPADVYVSISLADRMPVFLPSPTPGLWRSTDGGTSWSEVSGSLRPCRNLWWATPLPGSPGTLLLSVYGGGIHRYDGP